MTGRTGRMSRARAFSSQTECLTIRKMRKTSNSGVRSDSIWSDRTLGGVGGRAALALMACAAAAPPLAAVKRLVGEVEQMLQIAARLFHHHIADARGDPHGAVFDAVGAADGV